MLLFVLIAVKDWAKTLLDHVDPYHLGIRAVGFITAISFRELSVEFVDLLKKYCCRRRQAKTPVLFELLLLSVEVLRWITRTFFRRLVLRSLLKFLWFVLLKALFLIQIVKAKESCCRRPAVSCGIDRGNRRIVRLLVSICCRLDWTWRLRRKLRKEGI